MLKIDKNVINNFFVEIWRRKIVVDSEKLIINKKLNVKNVSTSKRLNNKKKLFKMLLIKCLRNRNEFETFFNLNNLFLIKKLLFFNCDVDFEIVIKV